MLVFVLNGKLKSHEVHELRNHCFCSKSLYWCFQVCIGGSDFPQVKSGQLSAERLNSKWIFVEKIIPFTLLTLYSLLPEGLSVMEYAFWILRKRKSCRYLFYFSLSEKKRVLKVLLLERELQNNNALIWCCIVYMQRGSNQSDW